MVNWQRKYKSIETLVEKWHTSLPEASRIVAQQSHQLRCGLISLTRMAFSIEAGQAIDAFMRSEQETVSEQYSTLYDTRLESVDIMKEIYVSLSSCWIIWIDYRRNTFGVIWKLEGRMTHRLKWLQELGSYCLHHYYSCLYKSVQYLPLGRRFRRIIPLQEMN